MNKKKRIEKSLKMYNESICEDCEDNNCDSCNKLDTRSADDVMADNADSENDSRRDDPEIYEDL